MRIHRRATFRCVSASRPPRFLVSLTLVPILGLPARVCRRELELSLASPTCATCAMKREKSKTGIIQAPPLLQSIPNSGAFLTRLKADSSELAATIIYAWDHGGAKDRVLETEFGCPTSQSLLDQISSFLMYNAHEKSIAAQFTFGLRPPCPAALLRHFFCLAQWSICFSIPSLRMYSQLRRQLSDHRERLQTNPSWYSPVMWETSKLATKVREKLALEWVARRCSAEYGEDFFVWRGWPSSCPGCLDGGSFWSCQPTVVLVRQVPAPCSRAP